MHLFLSLSIIAQLYPEKHQHLTALHLLERLSLRPFCLNMILAHLVMVFKHMPHSSHRANVVVLM